MPSTYFQERMAQIDAERMANAAAREAASRARAKAELAEAARLRKRAEQEHGYVYFMRSGNVVKIGFSTNPRGRVKSLRTARPEASFICKIVKGGPATERKFHERFAAYRQAGEWFDLSGDLARYLERCIHPIELPEKVKSSEEDIRL